MACPYRGEFSLKRTDSEVHEPNSKQFTGENDDKENEDPAQTGINKVTEKGLTYNSYLKTESLLSAQQMVTSVHDEHLFIVTHQAYELWFKQIVFELDSIAVLFSDVPLEEEKMFLMVSRMTRIVKIWKLLVDQIFILETMTPSDFMNFRGHLSPASGFQSLQFRIMENKLGIKQKQRVKYNQMHYAAVFSKDEEKRSLLESETQPSLLDNVERWLERTPGLDKDGFNFWGKFQNAVHLMLAEAKAAVDAMAEGSEKEEAGKDFEKQRENFTELFSETAHQRLLARGDRRMSYKAFQGALMVYFYSEESRFHEPYRFLSLLMDVDSLLTKWRYNHVMMVQRMIGFKPGTGGSSGFHYLRSTVSMRYQVFLDLFNSSSYLIPRNFIPPLTPEMKANLTF